MKMYSIWSEGYAVTGQSGQAQYICASEGSSFREACFNAWKAGKFEGYGGYDEVYNSLWGCKLYDNLADAQYSFG